MFSVENFYYVLYTNLLKSTKFLIWYFYPYGSTNIDDFTSRIDLQHKGITPNTSHSLFSNSMSIMGVATCPMTLYYDQEPIQAEVVDKIVDRAIFFKNFQKLILLGNSEHSELKDSLCKTYNLQDWYYFYHGFAALDWYRDYRYIPLLENQFDKVFISMNRLVTKDRSYRLYLVSKYMEKNLLDYGNVSLILDIDEFGSWEDELLNPNSKLTVPAKKLIKTQISTLDKSLTIDKNLPPGSASADSGDNEISLLQSSLWHVVSETVFYYKKLHLTEKVFKPIVARRPFILVAAPGNLAYLKSYGFKTFDRWIDESYDQETDDFCRLDMITEELEKLCRLNSDQLKDMHLQMQDVLEYNFQHFYGDFQNIIVDELVDNFEKAVTDYNQQVKFNKLDISNLDLTRVKQRLSK